MIASITLNYGDPSRGIPFPSDVRDHLESALETDLSAIRIHLGSEAVQLGFRAFAHGTDIYFQPDQFSPDTRGGMQLVVHELMHVVQQRLLGRTSSSE